MRTAINFRKRIFIIVILALVPAKIVYPQGASLQSSQNSVVSITAKKTLNAKSAEKGTGFVWSKPNYVVTALHVVAGARYINIYSHHARKTSDAKVIAVIREADLALLELEDQLNLTPLKDVNVNPNSSEEFYIWGYPRDVATIQGDHIRFSLSNTQTPTLKNIFGHSKKLKEAVGKQGYPSINSRILRISSIIQPGHSGAPILNKQGLVVGIGDGGLRKGIARLNWAIPAKVYLPNLPNSEDEIPSGSAQKSSLMSTSVQTEATIKTSGSTTLRKVLTVSLEEVLSTADSDIVDVFNDIAKEAEEDGITGIENALIDIYEDFETGATIAVPNDLLVKYDSSTGTLNAGNEHLEMIVQIMTNDNWGGGIAALNQYENHLKTLSYWEYDPEMPDDKFIDEENAGLLISKFRYTPDEQNNSINEINMTLIIDDNDFLGTAVVARNMAEFTDKTFYDFYVMHMCVELADFSIE